MERPTPPQPQNVETTGKRNARKIGEYLGGNVFSGAVLFTGIFLLPTPAGIALAAGGVGLEFEGIKDLVTKDKKPAAQTNTKSSRRIS